MKTALLYMQDDYTRVFQAQVVSASPGNLVLDRTAFFPTGGHQACDLGEIRKGAQALAGVTGVKKVGPIIVHEIEPVSGNFAEGDTVEGVIDWARRYYHMQLHTAQHLFARSFLDRYGVPTWRSDLSVEGGLTVMDNPIAISEVMQVEADVNVVISRALPVERVLIKDRAHIRIEGFSEDECGGTHVRNTAEINLFKVHRLHEQNVYFQVGERALKVAFSMANRSLEVIGVLGISDYQQIPGKLAEIAKDAAAQQETINRLRERMTQLQIQMALAARQQVSGSEVLLLDLRHLHSKEAKREMVPLEKQGRAILCVAENNSLLIWSGSSSIRAKEVMGTLSHQWSMRGGGSDTYAQGGPYPSAVADPLAELLQVLNGGLSRGNAW